MRLCPMARHNEHDANLELSPRTDWRVGHAWHRPPPKRPRQSRDRWHAILRRLGIYR